MADIQIETREHVLSSIGFTEDNSVVITFENGPFDGEVVIDADKFERLHKSWNEFRNRDSET